MKGDPGTGVGFLGHRSSLLTTTITTDRPKYSAPSRLRLCFVERSAIAAVSGPGGSARPIRYCPVPKYPITHRITAIHRQRDDLDGTAIGT